MIIRDRGADRRRLPGPTRCRCYRDRHATSGATGCRRRNCADLVRTDRHNHRLVAADSDTAEAVMGTKPLEPHPGHQQLRNSLRETRAPPAAFEDLQQRCIGPHPDAPADLTRSDQAAQRRPLDQAAGPPIPARSRRSPHDAQTQPHRRGHLAE